MKPSSQRILRHLEAEGSITPMEALAVYSNPRLAASIYDIRRAGHKVTSVVKRDQMGHKYTKYTFEV